MSKTLDQIFIANPITSNASTDLMYFVQSPYSAGTDAGMTYANFSAQFTSNVLTTKGDLLSYTTVPARLAVGTTNGQVLQVNSGAAAGLSYSTATYPATTTVNQLLYSSSANVVAGLATANSATLFTTTAGVPTFTGSLTNGQVLIGSTGANPALGTLTAGTGITITNGAASITISATGENAWVDQTTGSVTMSAGTGYTTDNGASLVTYTLPVTANLGDFVEVNGFSAGGWAIAQATGQQIHLGNKATTSGATGSLASTNQYDQIRLRCAVAGGTIWVVVSAVGNITVV